MFGKRVELQVTNPGNGRPGARSGHLRRRWRLAALVGRLGAGAGRSDQGRTRQDQGAPPAVPRLRRRAHGRRDRPRIGRPRVRRGHRQARPVINGLRAGVILGLVLALWVAAAIVFIPRLSDQFTAKNSTTAATRDQCGRAVRDGGRRNRNRRETTGGTGGTGGTDGPVPSRGRTGRIRWHRGRGRRRWRGGASAGTVVGPVSTGVTVTVESTSLADAAAAGARDPGRRARVCERARSDRQGAGAAALTAAPDDGRPAQQTYKTRGRGVHVRLPLRPRLLPVDGRQRRVPTSRSTSWTPRPSPTRTRWRSICRRRRQAVRDGDRTGRPDRRGHRRHHRRHGLVEHLEGVHRRRGKAGTWSMSGLSTPGTTW